MSPKCGPCTHQGSDLWRHLLIAKSAIYHKYDFVTSDSVTSNFNVAVRTCIILSADHVRYSDNFIQRWTNTNFTSFQWLHRFVTDSSNFHYLPWYHNCYTVILPLESPQHKSTICKSCACWPHISCPHAIPPDAVCTHLRVLVQFCT